MKKVLILTSFVFAFHRASAALPFYDPFADQTANGGTSYSVGSGLANQSNSSSIYQLINSGAGAPQPTIVAGNLSSTILPRSSGNSVVIVPASAEGERLNYNVTNASGRIYYSFLINITNIDAVPETADNNWFSGFGDGTGGQATPLLRIGAKILTLKSGTGYKFGVGKNSTTTTFIYEDTVHNLGETVFVVAAYEQLPGTATNALLWVNPAPASFGAISAPTPTLSISTPGTGPQGVLNSSVKSFILACQNPTAPTAIIDELRIGTNWSDVAPLGDPAILQNPISQTVSPGTNVSFSATATGTPALHYQWIKNGTTLLSNSGNISGADTATLHIGNISAGDVGAYSVVVTNGLGNTIQSSSANLLLSDPAILTQPQSRTNGYSTTATFTVVVSGTAPFSYQWSKEGTGDLTDGGNISGSHSNTLTLTNVSLSDAGNYLVTVSNSAGPTSSATAILTVKDPYITQQPASATNTSGATVTFHVTAVGSGSVTYQWYKNGTNASNALSDVGNVSGTTTDTLIISNISNADEANYSVVVIGSALEYSTDAHLTVLSPVTITNQPISRTVAVGSKVAFNVGASGAAPLTYQWYLNGTNIVGATSPSYTLTNVSLSASGNYTVVVSNSVAPATSTPATLTVSTNIQLYETNLVVVRIGDSAQTLTMNGNSIFLDQFDTSGTYVNTINIPDDGSTGMTALGWDNMSGPNSGSTTGTSLTRSLDGRFMVVVGYNTNLNYGADLSASISTNVPRGIGLFNSHAQYTMPVASTNSVFDQTFWRAAVTDGTNNFWGVGGKTGTYYFGFDAPPVLVQNTFDNIRSMGLFNGNIYCVTAASFVGQTNKGGLLKINGMPTNAVTPTVVFDSTVGASSGGYDLAVSPSGNLIYLCDQRNVAVNGGGIQRYDFDGSNWTLTYTLKTGFGTFGPRYIAADFSGANPVLYVTSNDGTFDNNRIIKFVDTGAGSTGTVIASAGVNQTFRGIHFGPVASAATVASPVLLVSRNGGNVILSWIGTFTLQASTNVVGTYTNIVGVTSPYTNSTSSPAQLFFRLHQ